MRHRNGEHDDTGAGEEARALDTPLYNSRITSTYVRLVRKRYPQVDLDAVLRHAGMALHQVEDEGHWFTQRQVNRFQEKLRELTGNQGIAREAGLYSASPEALSGIARYILGLASPGRAYALAGKFTAKFTRSSRIESRSTGPTSVEILSTPNAGVREEPFQCENRQGYLLSIPRLFHGRLPRIEHPECIFRGDPRCRYLISWEPSPAARWRTARLAAIPPVLALLGASAAGLFPWPPLVALLPGAAIALLLLSIAALHHENRELRETVAHLEHSSDDLVDQVNLNYENALMINEVGQGLAKERSIKDILDGVVDVLKRRLDYDRGLVMLANPDATKLLALAGYGYAPEQIDLLEGEQGFHIGRKSSRGILARCFHERRPFLVNDLDAAAAEFSPRSVETARRIGVQSFICCPIVYEDEAIGVLAADNRTRKRPLLQRDVNLLMGIAPQIAICIRNVRLTEGGLRQFQSIIQVLVASTEARDPLTAGHSQKVTEYVLGICRELGLSQEYTEMMRVASVLHDYGKIGIYDEILKKPGRLTAEEYEIVKTHVVKTRDILRQINFEGIYHEVPSIAGAHHEHLDGTGYPDGLRGDEIPIGARILAVADVYEALTSQRHYRDPMPEGEVFDHLLANSGRHFDRSCVEALLRHCRERATAAR
jgi:HD-GYP domain-containing protein (c-di-GMP phosphodiesterase class II)